MSLGRHFKYSGQGSGRGVSVGGPSLKKLGLVTKPREQEKGWASRTIGTRCVGTVGTFLSFMAFFLLLAYRFPAQGSELMVPEFDILCFLPLKRDFLVSDSVVKIPWKDSSWIDCGHSWPLLGWSTCKKVAAPAHWSWGESSSQKKGESLDRQDQAGVSPSRAGVFILMLCTAFHVLMNMWFSR